MSCTQEELYIPQEPEFEVQVPVNFPALPTQVDNPMTAAGIALGERLFFDKCLSGSNEISCASCHIPSLAFTDGSTLSTKGISGKPLLRHIPAIMNLAWADNGLFWDGGSTNLESQAFAPLGHEDEMYQDLEELEKELSEDATYTDLFQQAFGGEIQVNRVMMALAQFQRSLISSESTYDHMVREEPGGSFSSLAWEGYMLFEEKCAQCHVPDLFTDHDYHNNGLDATFNDFSEDELYLGRYRVTRDPEDIGKYKTPTLRNVAITAPYMHDGRFNSLKEVLNFYANGVQDSETLDPILKQNNRLGIDLSEAEKQALIAFLNTLTDETFINDERFAEY
tara:strand:+ start:1962 stop:2972 length:1011 start_codon:yes stop_codon:yes gene_type:complete